jgi:hypothetical protein
LRIIEHEHIDQNKWDLLVENTPDSTIFSLSIYLNAVAENWCILVNEDYTSGLALPYSIRLGVETLYTPFFCMYIEWLGDVLNSEDQLAVERIITNRFKQANINLKTPFLNKPYSTLVTQELTEVMPNKQAVRMLKKCKKSCIDVIEVIDSATIIHIIQSELTDKIDTFTPKTLSLLSNLISSLEKSGLLISKSIIQDNKTSGGMLFMSYKNRVIYLKGAALKNTRDSGGLYFCMYEAIKEYTHDKKIVDFGGSNIEGVRRFNINMGGVDKAYSNYEWHNGPFWFDWIRKVRNSWNKK